MSDIKVTIVAAKLTVVSHRKSVMSLDTHHRPGEYHNWETQFNKVCNKRNIGYVIKQRICDISKKTNKQTNKQKQTKKKKTGKGLDSYSVAS